MTKKKSKTSIIVMAIVPAFQLFLETLSTIITYQAYESLPHAFNFNTLSLAFKAFFEGFSKAIHNPLYESLPLNVDFKVFSVAAILVATLAIAARYKWPNGVANTQNEVSQRYKSLKESGKYNLVAVKRFMLHAKNLCCDLVKSIYSFLKTTFSLLRQLANFLLSTMKFLGCLPRVVQQLYDIFYDTIPWSKGDAGRSYCLLSASIVVFAIGLSVVIAYTMFPLWVLFTWAMGHYLAVRMLAMDIWWCVQRLLWFLKLSFWPLMLLLSWFCIYWTWRQYSVLYTQISVFLKAKAGICRTWVENIMAWKPVESTQPPLGTDCEYIDEPIRTFKSAASKSQ